MLRLLNTVKESGRVRLLLKFGIKLFGHLIHVQ